MLVVGRLDRLPMVGKSRHLRHRAELGRGGIGILGPVGAKPELAVRQAEAIEEMRLLEGRLAVDPARRLELLQRAAPRIAQSAVDHLARRHLEAADGSAPTRRARPADDLVIVAAFARRIDQLAARAGCAAARRPGRRRHARRTSSRAARCRPCGAVSVMTCSWTTVKRSSRAKPRLTTSWSGATDIGLVFWMSSAVTGGPPHSASRVAGQHGADARLVELAHGGIAHVEAFDERFAASRTCRNWNAARRRPHIASCRAPAGWR